MLTIAIKIQVKSWLTALHTTQNKEDGGDKCLKQKTETEVVGLTLIFPVCHWWAQCLTLWMRPDSPVL